MNLPSESDDKYHLDRFVEAQSDCYEDALHEIRAGRKQTHWMWFIFPQFRGLGSSPTAQRYAIQSIEEAQAYLDHLILGPRLRECCEALWNVEGKSAHEILGSPDDMKLQSCATLFAGISPPDSIFQRLLAKYYRGQKDEKTLRLLDLND